VNAHNLHRRVEPSISSASILGSPIRRASSAAPQKPEAGPLSTIVMGVRDVAARLSTPQLDCMM
jgi:hypothetical protein